MCSHCAIVGGSGQRRGRGVRLAQILEHEVPGFGFLVPLRRRSSAARGAPTSAGRPGRRRRLPGGRRCAGRSCARAAPVLKITERGAALVVGLVGQAQPHDARHDGREGVFDDDLANRPRPSTPERRSASVRCSASADFGKGSAVTACPLSCSAHGRKVRSKLPRCRRPPAAHRVRDRARHPRAQQRACRGAVMARRRPAGEAARAGVLRPADRRGGSLPAGVR